MPLTGQRIAHVPGAKVISYYTDADGQFGPTKIGYDVDLFDEAVRNIAFGELRKPKNPDQDKETAELVKKVNELKTTTETEVEAEEKKIEIRKEDIQLICTQLEVNFKRAESALKASKGSLKEALIFLLHEKDTNF